MPVSHPIAAARQCRHDRRIAKALPHIPEGPYCYKITESDAASCTNRTSSHRRIETCPCWRLRKDKPAQRNGFCRLLKSGDWMPLEKGGTMLLWDGVKECGLNPGEDD